MNIPFENLSAKHLKLFLLSQKISIKDCIENDCKNYKPVLPRQEKVRLDFF